MRPPRGALRKYLQGRSRLQIAISLKVQGQQRQRSPVSFHASCGHVPLPQFPRGQAQWARLQQPRRGRQRRPRRAGRRRCGRHGAAPVIRGHDDRGGAPARAISRARKQGLRAARYASPAPGACFVCALSPPIAAGLVPSSQRPIRMATVNMHKATTDAARYISLCRKGNVMMFRMLLV